jgi:uncharacterized coiled-coil protein SlyX
MDKLKPCPNCENLKHPDFPCIRCYPLNPVFVRRPASNTNTDTALAAAETRIAEQGETIVSQQERISELEKLVVRSAKGISQSGVRIATLEKALEPFAREAGTWGEHEDETEIVKTCNQTSFFPINSTFTVGDLRRAAALLKEKE